MKKERLSKLLNRQWDTQGFNAVPIFLNHAAYSGLTMKRRFKIGYTHFIFQYKNGFGQMYYDPKDFLRLWEFSKQKLNKDPNFISKIKKEYEIQFSEYLKYFQTVPEKIKSPSDQILLDLFKKVANSVTEAVGIAHILEGLTFGLEQELKLELKKIYSSEKFISQAISKLTQPEEDSFLTIEEKRLKKIGKMSPKEKDKAFVRHAKEYFWLQNNYAKTQNLTSEYFKKKLSEISKNSGNNKGKNILPKFKTTPRLSKLITWTKQAAIWQDERKRNILICIGYLDLVCKKTSYRTGIPISQLYYIGVKELQKAKTLKDIIRLKPKLKIREKGSVFLLQSPFEEKIISGKEYRKVEKKFTRQPVQTNKSKISGSIANTGKVVGKVIVCNNLKSISQVKTGDIIVASMTRPEYMPGLKKAIGIITDEGGITCHAAIVSRELGIPCIIGTKVATKIFKTGDMVELNANHGIAAKI